MRHTPLGADLGLRSVWALQGLLRPFGSARMGAVLCWPLVQCVDASGILDLRGAHVKGQCNVHGKLKAMLRP